MTIKASTEMHRSIYPIRSYWLTTFPFSGCSVTRLCLILCNPMNYSTPGFPVPHYLHEFAQIHVHWVNDAIPLSFSVAPFSCLQSLPASESFSNESVLRNRWPKYRSFGISLSNEYLGLISFRLTCWISLQSKGLSRVFSNTTVQKHQFFGAQLSLYRSNSHIHTWLLEKP